MDPSLSPFLVTGALIVYAQRWMKSFDWYQAFVKVVPGADRWAHRLVAGVGALIGALGIGITTKGAADVGWSVVVTIPAAAALLHGCWNFLLTFGSQQVIYDMTRTRPEPDGVVLVTKAGV